MKALIFAAGKGTRLKPLTDNTPKALIKLNGIPMLEHVITKLISSGVTELIINVHYLAGQIIDFLRSKNNFGIRIEISDESGHLLDTGGGLKKAFWFFNDTEPFIVYNTDILSNIDLNQMLGYHIKNKSIATLAVRERDSSRYFLFNDEMKLCGWKNIKTNEIKTSKESPNLIPLAFSGIHIMNPEVFQFLNKTGSFSIVDIYLEIAKTKSICGFDHSSDYWFDIGNLQNLKNAEKFLNTY